MKASDAVKHYSNREVQEQIIQLGRGREVVPNYGGKGFGKRPAMLLYEREVYDLARQGATSFHASEERWINPMMLEQSTPSRKLDELRKGWDLILDVDTDNFDYAKKTTFLLAEALKSHGITSLSLKFSGNKGFHLAVPFESFPKYFNGKETRELFPEAPRFIAGYLKEFIKKILAKDLGENPYDKVSVDTVFLAPRHLFRMPYSLHEKSGLASIPIKVEELMNFNKDMAKPENLKIVPYLQEYREAEASELLKQAYKWAYEQEEDEKSERKEFSVPKTAAPEELFPPCIKKLLLGVKDGRKRAVFVLINFLRSVGWDLESIEKKLFEWNEKNEEPLRKGYIKSQLNWHKKLKSNYSPPNCSNNNYYADLGIKCADHICSKVKNPSAFTILRIKNARSKLQNNKRTSKE